ncbi:MAG: FliG C-terminal domain-containing protein, partial [Elusimicrobiota bacterium]|nr:FliG C-terminal domain-containing protein [Elusimicrobiota bacterium]
IKEKPAKAKELEEEIELPGLPVTPAEVGSKEIEKFVIDQWIFSDKFRIKYLDISVLLDEKAFSSKDIEFVKTVTRGRVGIDEMRGDTLTVKVLSFPPPVEELGIKKEEVTKKPKSLLNEVYPYLYFGGTVLGLLLFVIILLQVINMIKMKKIAQELFPPYGLRLPTKTQISAARLPEARVLPLASEKQVFELPPEGQTETPQERKDIFYELRQLMVTTLIGNPELTSEIFKRWVEVDKDDGIYRVAGFLKATDSRLIELLSGYLGQDIASKVEFAMNQMVSIDKEGLIETFKKFREEFQKEQSLRAERITEAGEQDDIFQFLKQLTVEQIFHIIKDEPASIIAIVLAQLPSKVTNTILKDLPAEKQSRVPVEMGKLKKIPISAYRDIADRLAKKALEVEKIKYVTTDGVEALVNLLEQSSPEKEQEILAAIAEHDLLLAEELRKVYIPFDEISRLPDKILSEILRGLDRDTIRKSLVDTKPELKNKILNNLPPRTKIIISDELKVLEESAEIPVEEIQEARRAITRKIRDLVRSGKIDLRKILT